jgi:hypothetical protein
VPGIKKPIMVSRVGVLKRAREGKKRGQGKNFCNNFIRHLTGSYTVMHLRASYPDREDLRKKSYQ